MSGGEAAQILREHADWVESQFPPDVFLPLSKDRVAAVHAAFVSAGVTVDAWSAEVMRDAARLARYRADQMDGES